MLWHLRTSLILRHCCFQGEPIPRDNKQCTRDTLDKYRPFSLSPGLQSLPLWGFHTPRSQPFFSDHPSARHRTKETIWLLRVCWDHSNYPSQVCWPRLARWLLQSPNRALVCSLSLLLCLLMPRAPLVSSFQGTVSGKPSSQWQFFPDLQAVLYLSVLMRM